MEAELINTESVSSDSISFVTKTKSEITASSSGTLKRPFSKVKVSTDGK